MTPLKIRSHVGADGIVHLPLPNEYAEKDVFITVEPVEVIKTPDGKGWPPGFFESTFGSWIGPAMIREDRGEYEQRELG